MKTNKVTYNAIRHYLDGSLDPKEMHELEKEALDDPFLAEAIEGYSENGAPAAHHLSLLQRRLEERILQQQENKNNFFFTWQRLSIAAAAGLMFIAAGILFWMKAHNYQRQMQGTQKEVEVTLTDADALRSGLIDEAQPAAGWENYRAYLRNHVRIAVSDTGTVTVRFNVGENGRLSGFRIVNGLNDEADKEALRLIKEGPAWSPPYGVKSSEITVAVKFSK